MEDIINKLGAVTLHHPPAHESSPEPSPFPRIQPRRSSVEEFVNVLIGPQKKKKEGKKEKRT